MLLECIVSVFAVLFILFVFLSPLRRRHDKYPPGPFSWPIFGNLLQVGLESYKSVAKMRKIYGDIIAIDLGTRRAVYINEYKLLKEAFSNPAFAGRCKMQHWADQETGILGGMAFSSGKTWAEQRKFALSYIKSGIRNGTAMESLLMDEISILIEDLKEVCEQPMDMTHVFTIPSINTLWDIIAGKKYSLKDPAFMKLIKHSTIIQQSTLFQGLFLFYPRLSEMFPKLSGYQKFRENIKPIDQFMKDIIDNHKKTYEEGVQRDLVDAYLHKIKKTTDPNSSFYGITGERNLWLIVRDFFLAGTETVSTTLSWIVFLTALHPEIQRNLISALKLYFKHVRSPSLKDRKSLPYVEAVIHEVLRFSGMLPLPLFHETVQDVNFRGYKLPKGTTVVANHYAMMNDPEVWGDPENFRPERFLSQDGKELIGHEGFVAFGIGPRVCPGEFLARDELFLFTASLFLNFKIEFDPSHPVPAMDYMPGFVIAPVPHRVIFHQLSD